MNLQFVWLTSILSTCSLISVAIRRFENSSYITHTLLLLILYFDDIFSRGPSSLPFETLIHLAVNIVFSYAYL